MTSPDPSGLVEKARSFAEETASLLEGVLPHPPPMDVLRHRDRYVIRPGGESSDDPAVVPLFIAGQRTASLQITFLCRLDSVGRYLAIEQSTFGLHADVDRTPVLRFEYHRDMHSAPHAHIHVHAHRGALSHLLSKADHQTPHDISSLHIPVGGSRFRPCLEDLLQFLIEECRFDALPGWKPHVEAGRERWRRRQVAAVVRNVHTTAAKTLRDLGYTVEPPRELPPEEHKALHSW